MKDTAISLKLEGALKTKLLVLAKEENRTLSNFIEKLLKNEVARHEREAGRVRKG
jgi:predicted transcriptional regulator